MKKFLILITITLLLTLGQMQFASAVQSDGYIHNNHYYAVSFDGEGDAIVRAVIEIENTVDHPLKWINLEIPGSIVVYKAVQESPYRQVISYEKTPTSSATILRLELPNAIEKRATGTIVLFYKIPRYAQKDLFGNYEFDFKTMIDKDAILVENVRVAVNAQEGLFLKGGESEVDYKPNIGFVSEMAMTKAMDASIESQYYQDYYYGIKNANGVVKTAQNLDAWESFHVKGNFGENWLALYFAEVATGIIILFGLLLGAGLVLKKGSNSIKGKKINANPYIESTGISVLLSIGITITLLGGFILAQLISELSYSLNWASLLIMLLAFLVCASALFIVPIFVASKKGALQGAIVFFGTAILLVLIVIMLALLASLLTGPRILY